MHKLVAGQEVDIPGFILMSEFGYAVHSTVEMIELGYVTVMPHNLKFTVPVDFNLVPFQVIALEKKRDKLREEFNKRVSQINEQISNLTCIEFSPAEDDVDTRFTEVEDDEPDYCAGCNGSGEGSYDGSTCSACKGRGEL